MNNGYFGNLTKEDKKAYRLFVDRITSDDLRKRKRAINNEKTGLRNYQTLLSCYSSMVENRMIELHDKISLNSNLIGKNILDNL